MAAFAAALACACVLAACSSDGSDDSEEPQGSASSPSATPSTAEPAPKPDAKGCHDLSYEDALAPTTDSDTSPCAKPHTTETYAVGELDTVVDGHLVAVDSDYVQQQPASECTPRLRTWLGGSLQDLRLSMLRPVWFTPTLEESDAGAAWYRCDVIAVSGPESLAKTKGSKKGVLDSPRADEFAMCGTAAPDTKEFTRVMCGDEHTWRAIEVVPLPGKDYPGVKRAKDAGQEVCNDAGREFSDDALDYEWGYEWPTTKQWKAGQTYGLCWAPD